MASSFFAIFTSSFMNNIKGGYIMVNGYYNRRMTIEFFENGDDMYVQVRNSADENHVFKAEGKVVEDFLDYILNGIYAIEDHIEKVEA